MYETLISTDKLAALTGESDSELIIVDCRFSLGDPSWGYRAYSEGHIPGAIYAHLDDDLAAPVVPGVTGRHPLPDPVEFAGWLGIHGIGNETQVVVYDQAAGGIAARLWWMLRWLGHDRVAVLDGGWAAWCGSELPIEIEVRQPETRTFLPNVREPYIASVDVVQDWAKSPAHVIVDSRDASRYAGIDEPIDPVAGHIPSAVNLPFKENVNENGRWKSKEELRARFSGVASVSTPENIVFYCGSGVTGCHNVLAFCHAGLGDARLYPGSWSEWIADPKREIETG